MFSPQSRNESSACPGTGRIIMMLNTVIRSHLRHPALPENPNRKRVEEFIIEENRRVPK